MIFLFRIRPVACNHRLIASCSSTCESKRTESYPEERGLVSKVG
jgi:hypothetical protein